MFFGVLIAAAALQAGEPSEDPLQRFVACGEIAAAEARLACYDGVRDAVAPRVESGEVVAVDRAAVAEAAAQARDRSFGLPSVTLPSVSLPTLPIGEMFEGGANDAVAQADLDPETDEIDGMEIAERDSEGRPSVVVMDIVAIGSIGYQQYRFRMSNGQVWEQTSSDRIRLPDAGESAEAHIQRTRTGAHLLRIDGRGSTVRVRRVE